MSGQLYISYGMTKAGSTLGFELTRSALLAAGFAQPALPMVDTEGRELRKDARINFVSRLDKAALRDMIAFCAREKTRLVVKTHSRPSPAMIEAIEAGTVQAQAIYRDPRDIVLSLLDAGAHARRENRPAFSEIHDIDSALTTLRHQTDSLAMWLSLPDVLPLDYETLAFDRETAFLNIADHLHIPAEFDSVEKELATRFTQLNRGVSKRFENEMPADSVARITAEFAPFLEALFPSTHIIHDPVLAKTATLRQMQ